MVEWMTKAQRLFFTTGYDGTIKAELRVIEAREPVLSAKEYKKLGSSTPTIVLSAPTGRFAIADYAAMMKSWPDEAPGDSLVIEASPGNYKACVFGFPTSRWDTVVAVLCRTEEAAPNTVGTVDSLFS